MDLAAENVPRNRAADQDHVVSAGQSATEPTLARRALRLALATSVFVAAVLVLGQFYPWYNAYTKFGLNPDGSTWSVEGPPVPLPLPGIIKPLVAALTAQVERHTFASGADFINTVGAAAQSSRKTTGVPASVTGLGYLISGKNELIFRGQFTLSL